MHIGQIIKADSANGIGIRLSIFVSGCLNRCPGCFQPETWDFHYGSPYDEEMKEEILAEISKPYYKGVTFLGGDPLEEANQAGVLEIIEAIKEKCPDRTVWMYTGYVYEDLVAGGKRHFACTDALLDQVDVLVDGRFEQELKDITLSFRGSSNQRIIDVQATRSVGGGEIKLLEF